MTKDSNQFYDSFSIENFSSADFGITLKPYSDEGIVPYIDYQGSELKDESFYSTIGDPGDPEGPGEGPGGAGADRGADVL